MSTETKSLFTLIGELPDVISRLISAEIERIKVELGYKAKNVGFGILLIVIALFVTLFFLGALVASGILALALVMPGWAAALTMAGILLLVIGGLSFWAVRRFQRAGEDVGLTDEWRRDVDAVKGMGPYDN
ncbi:MAG: phage holin family protein [Microbacteriaceae bacterium]